MLLLFVYAIVLHVYVEAQGNAVVFLYYYTIVFIGSELQFLSLEGLATTLSPNDDHAEPLSLSVPLPLGSPNTSYYSTAYVSQLVSINASKYKCTSSCWSSSILSFVFCVQYDLFITFLL